MTDEKYQELRAEIFWTLIAPESAQAIVKALPEQYKRLIKTEHLLVVDLLTEHERGELTDEQYAHERKRAVDLAKGTLTLLTENNLATSKELAIITTAIFAKYSFQTKPNQKETEQ